MFGLDEIEELFQEAQALGTRFRQAHLAFGADVSTDLHTVGSMPMPWDKIGFSEWSRLEVQHLEEKFRRIRAERALEEESRPVPQKPSRRRRRPPRLTRPPIRTIDARWSAILASLRQKALGVEVSSISKEKRDRIVELHFEGKSHREIALDVGVSRQTVARYTPGYFRRRVLEMIGNVFDELDSKGIPSAEIASLVALHGEVGWTCPVHPEAEPDVDIMDGSDCKLCIHEGIKRFHQRHKEAGHPVLPPRNTKRTV